MQDGNSRRVSPNKIVAVRGKDGKRLSLAMDKETQVHFYQVPEGISIIVTRSKGPPDWEQSEGGSSIVAEAEDIATILIQGDYVGHLIEFLSTRRK